MQRPARVRYVVKIEQWFCDYHFGVDETTHRTGPYYDIRHVRLLGPIIEPKGVVKAPRGEVICFPLNDLIGASERPVRRFGDRTHPPKEPPKIRPVGRVSYRGKLFSAHLDFPSDALQLILTMLAAAKYRHVVFDAEKGSRDAEVRNFYLCSNPDHEDDLAANWDDV